MHAPGKHTFDPVSGWCIGGCPGYREDGRLMSFGGDVYRPGREYTPDELQTIRERAMSR
jgi:hypothetical protein